jgi:hypothetical protein
MGRKAQSSFEFLLLVGIVFLFVVIFVGATYTDVATLSKKREFLAVKDIAMVMQNELVLAAQVEDGYKRSFELPEDINGKPYSAVIVANSLTVSTDSATYAVRIPSVVGNLAKGLNNITKESNIVTLNNG